MVEKHIHIRKIIESGWAYQTVYFSQTPDSWLHRGVKFNLLYTEGHSR